LSADCQDDYRRKAAPWLLAIDAADPLRDRARFKRMVADWLNLERPFTSIADDIDELAGLYFAGEPITAPAPAVPAPGELFKSLMDCIAEGPKPTMDFNVPPADWRGAVGSIPVSLDARCVGGHSWNSATGQICPVCGCANIASLPNGGYIGLRRTDAPFVPMTLTADQQAALRAVADAGQLAASTAREVLEGVTRP
jgi:hypothetical protein